MQKIYFDKLISNIEHDLKDNFLICENWVNNKITLG